MTKTCCRCKAVLPLAAYNKDSRTRDGARPECIECRRPEKQRYARENSERIKIKSREWQAKNPDKVRASYLKRTYGMTVPEWDAMFAAQDGKCFTCLAVGKLVVDHDHETGRVRGLLCSNCNVALGMLKDDPAVLRRMADYLD